jgi:molecular chaperone DnaJ
MHSQGFLMISTTCPVCRGEGRVIRKPCGTCDGSGLETQEDTLQVSIPAGIEDGSTLRLVGRGEAAPQGGHCRQPLRHLARQARRALRARRRQSCTPRSRSAFRSWRWATPVEVPTLDGEGAIEVPPGTQPGETVALRGRGMPRIDGRGPGDIVAHLKLVVPSSLSDGRGGAPACLRGIGWAARQPRARRLLQAQEEEIAGAATRRYHAQACTAAAW